MNKILTFDLETTGLDKYHDHIVQFAGCIYDIDTKTLLKKYDTYIKPDGYYSISFGSYLKTGITVQFLEDKPSLAEVAPKIIELFSECDNILTYNGLSFDIPFLNIELEKVGYHIDFLKKNCYDGFLIEKERHGNTLGKTFERYLGKSMEDAGYTAHNAFSDVNATFEIFCHQNDELKCQPEKVYGEDNIIRDLAFDGEMLPSFTIGKYRGAPLKFIAQIDKGYLEWAVSEKSKFDSATKEYIQTYLK